MAVRNLLLVAYDVREPNRLRRTYERMRGFGDPLQYSVFTCQLAPKERVLLIQALTEVINTKEDRVVIIDLGPSEGASERFEFLGNSVDLPDRQAAVF